SYNCWLPFANVAELVDAPDLGSGAERCESSSLSVRTTLYFIDGLFSLGVRYRPLSAALRKRPALSRTGTATVSSSTSDATRLPPGNIPASTKLRAWMRLPSGRHLDLIDPDPSAWEHQDLSIRLSRTYRWGGESCWPLPLSVAQHSLLVLELRRQAGPRRLGAADELFELLHDAEEGFLGFDCISPLKAALGAPFQEVANRLTSAIMQRYRLPDWNVEDYRLHKAADRRAAASEAVHCVG